MTKTIVTAIHWMILVVLLAFGPIKAAAQVSPAHKIPLEDALAVVEKKFGTKFAFEHDLLKGKFVNPRALEGKSAPEVLKNILYPNNLIFLYVSDNAYSIVSRKSSFFRNDRQPDALQEGTATSSIQTPGPGRLTVRGIVSDITGAALAFVNVWEKGTNNGTQTSDRGDFVLANVVPGDTLIFTHIGYQFRKLAVDGRSSLNVQLLADSRNTLNEVVVVSTGLQQLPKERATGSFATVSGRELEKYPVPNVVQRLEGLLPGVKINVLAGDRSFIYGGGVNGNMRSINSSTRTTGKNDYDVAIRGKGTLIAESFPLIVVDGAITEMDISTINPADIDNITFLKDAAAASVWGVRAANGVIVITTKKGRNTQVPAISFSTNIQVSGKPDLGYIRTMNSAQMIDYETELVNKNIFSPLNISPSPYYYTYYPAAGAALALMLKAGSITQQAYNTSIDSLKGIDNRGQISKYLLHAATSQQYNLSVSGGNAYSSYYYSGSYSREEPNVKRTIGQRLTLTLNNNWKLFKIVDLSTSLKGSFFIYNNNGIPLTTLFRYGSTTLLPYQQLVDNTGKSVSYYRGNPAFINSLAPGRPDWRYNFLDELGYNNNVEKDNNYVANIQLKVPLYRGLSASAMYTNEYSSSESRTYSDPQSYTMRDMENRYTDPSASTNSLGFNTNSGGLQMINTTINNYALRGQLSYDRTFGTRHQLNAIAGSEIRQTQAGQGSYALWGYNMATGIAPQLVYGAPVYASVYGGTSNFNEGGYPSRQDKTRRFLSYFGNAAYTYLNRYSLSASVRYDDYNNFGLDRKYRATPLWSAGAKWDLNKEAFLSKTTWINQLSLRTTYGVTGNIAFDQYPYTYIAAGSTDYTTNLPYATVINVANPQLKWEKTYLVNVGIDFSLLDNRIGGSLEYYHKSGRDLLFGLPVNPAYVGTIGNGSLTRNIASLNGKGIDASLRVIVYNNKDWNIAINGTFSYNSNKIIDKRIDSTSISAYTKSYTAGTISYQAGYATDKLLVYRNAGLSSTGLTRVYNQKGDTVTVTAPVYFKDLKYAGRTTAPYFGSLTPSVRFRQFTMSALITYQFGNVFLKPSIYSYMSRYSSVGYDLSADIARRWKQPGDEATTKIPGLNTNTTYAAYSLMRYQYSDINVLPGDYVRLRELALSYQVPIGNRFGSLVKNLSLSAAVRNLGLLWKANKEGYDPDFVSYAGTTYGLPPAKSYTFSLNVNF